MFNMKDNTCTSKITEKRYRVFSGVEIIYFASHTDSFELDGREKSSNQIFEITHCREGRLEYDLNENYCYLTPGDLAITQTNSVSPMIRFPLKHYHGITIIIDLDQAPRCLSCFLEDVNVEPKELMKKFCGSSHGFIVRSNQSIEHIFSELYCIPDKIRGGYLKVKILELFLFLSVFDTHTNEFEERTYSAAQARLAREIGQYLTGHISERITLKKISDQLHLSETHIKKTFKSVYGVTPRVYILEQKIESAAHMLEQTDKSVLEIANAYGYDNASKFASVFRSIKGMSPNEYRNKDSAKMERDITFLE